MNKEKLKKYRAQNEHSIVGAKNLNKLLRLDITGLFPARPELSSQVMRLKIGANISKKI